MVFYKPSLSPLSPVLKEQQKATMEVSGNTILVKEVANGTTQSVLVKAQNEQETSTTVQIENDAQNIEDVKEKSTCVDQTSNHEDKMKTNGVVKTMSSDSIGNTVNPEKNKQTFCGKISSILEKNHIKQKVIFLSSLSGLIVMCCCLVYQPWLLPYLYSVTAPPLLIYRLVIYWRFKWQLFMCDFCYFANVLCIVFLWGVPWQTEVFTIFYAYTTGPLPWATILYRNSLVFHSIDKLTSVYIHIFPHFLGFSVRWYSSSMSEYWYTDFVDTYNEGVGYMFVWLIGLPYAIFLLHVFSYTIIVKYVWIPGEQYVDSIRYLSGSQNGCTSKVLGCMGPTHTTFMYNAMCLLYGALSMFVLPLFYKYFITHCLLVVVVMLITIWNGASYYIDYFGPRAVKY